MEGHGKTLVGLGGPVGRSLGVPGRPGWVLGEPGSIFEGPLGALGGPRGALGDAQGAPWEPQGALRGATSDIGFSEAVTGLGVLGPPTVYRLR